jgi:hypothetical protein
MPVTVGLYVAVEPLTLVTVRRTVFDPRSEPIAIEAPLRLLGSSEKPAPASAVHTAGSTPAVVPQEREPVGRAMLVHQSGIGGAVGPDMTRTLPEDYREVRVRTVEHVRSGRHERRLDHHRAPARMQLAKQQGESRDVRARHRRPVEGVVVQSGVAHRRHGSNDVLAGSNRVGGVDATAAVDGRQENVDYKYVDHECVQENAAAQG